MKKEPKILIVSHNPLSDTQSNGKTITSLLSMFPKASLAQLYFTMDTPDFTICDNFFRITDLDILKNFFILNKDVGNVITSDYSKSISLEKSKLHSNIFYSLIRKMFMSKISIMTTIRDFVWRNSEYYSHKFEKWLDNFNPDIIFFQSSNCCFAFNFVYDICQKRNIKLIMQTTDDYLSYRNFGVFFNLNVYNLRRAYKKINSKTILILPISKKMEEYYKKYFNNNYFVTMNSVKLNNPLTKDEFKFGDKINILYAGNLGLNRWSIIYKLAAAINELNQNISIEVYSIEKPSKKILNKLNYYDCCKYKGSLDKKALELKRQQSDIFLHVESFDYINSHLTKYSISTKIPELMNLNKPILAIGPKNVASIEYLKENNSAWVINSNKKNEIKNSLQEFLAKKDYSYLIKNAQEVVKNNHNIKNVQDYLRKVIIDYYEKKDNNN